MTNKRTALINNLIVGTVFAVLSAVLFLFSLNSPKGSVIMKYFEESGYVHSYVPSNQYEPVDKDTLFSAEDYDGLPLYYATTSKKWHLAKECRYIRESKNVNYTDYYTAVSRGLSACSACGYPDELPD